MSDKDMWSHEPEGEPVRIPFDHCPTCGSRVLWVMTDGKTGHYRSVREFTDEERDAMATAIRLAENLLSDWPGEVEEACRATLRNLLGET